MKKFTHAIYYILLALIILNLGGTILPQKNCNKMYNYRFFNTNLSLKPALSLSNTTTTLNSTAPSSTNTNNFNKTEESGIKIRLNYKKYKAVYTDKFMKVSSHLIKEEIHTRHINHPYEQKISMIKKCVSSGSSYKNALLYTMPLLENTVTKAIEAVNVPPTDSKISFNPSSVPMFTITKDADGKKVSEEELYLKIYSALLKTPTPQITITPALVPPKVTVSDNIKLTELRARYTTGYSVSSENRKHNIRLALSKINGTVIQPNQEFSFNKTVGKRSKNQGYMEAKIIVGGRYVDGYGGGVCQVSTTLYNAALLSGLKILAVKNHTLECTYELPSFDAMVNSGSSDLRFINTGSTPVFLRAFGDDNKAVVEIFGSPLPLRIVRKSEVIFKAPPPQNEVLIDTEYKYHPIGEVSGTSKIVAYPHGELKSRGYLLYYDSNNFLIKKELIREDTYSSCPGLIAIAP